MARYTPELLASLRRAYENTDEPIRLIADRHAIGITTLQTLAAREGWAKRSQRMRNRPASEALLEEGHRLMTALPPRVDQNIGTQYGTQDSAAGFAPQAPAERAPPPSPAARLEALIVKEIAAEEAAREDLDGLPRMRGEADRCARTLAILGQALATVQKLRAEEKPAEDDDPVPDNVDEYRLELARRIRAFIEARQAAEAAEGEAATEE